MTDRDDASMQAYCSVDVHTPGDPYNYSSGTPDAASSPGPRPGVRPAAPRPGGIHLGTCEKCRQTNKRVNVCNNGEELCFSCTREGSS